MVVILKPASITMGDPAGIGPEIIVKALSRLESTIGTLFLGAQGLSKEQFKRLQ